MFFLCFAFVLIHVLIIIANTPGLDLASVLGDILFLEENVIISRCAQQPDP